MKVTIDYNVTCCFKCPYYSNSTQEHDDPFAPEPYPTIHFCNYFPPKTRREVYINHPHNEISKDCPITKKHKRM